MKTILRAIDAVFIGAGMIVAFVVRSAPFTGSGIPADPLPSVSIEVEANVQQEGAQEPEIDWSAPPWDPAPVARSGIPVLRAVHPNGMKKKVRKVQNARTKGISK